MIGSVATTLLVALFALVALRPPMPRHSSPFNVQFALAWWINEIPVIALWWLLSGVASTLIALRFDSGWWWLLAALGVGDALLLAWLVVRARTTRPAVSGALG